MLYNKKKSNTDTTEGLILEKEKKIPELKVLSKIKVKRTIIMSKLVIKTR